MWKACIHVSGIHVIVRTKWHEVVRSQPADDVSFCGDDAMSHGARAKTADVARPGGLLAALLAEALDLTCDHLSPDRSLQAGSDRAAICILSWNFLGTPAPCPGIFLTLSTDGPRRFFQAHLPYAWAMEGSWKPGSLRMRCEFGERQSLCGHLSFHPPVAPGRPR